MARRYCRCRQPHEIWGGLKTPALLVIVYQCDIDCDCAERASDNFVSGIAVLLVIGLTLLPWALLAFLLIWLYRRFGRRLVQGIGRPAEPERAMA